MSKLWVAVVALSVVGAAVGGAYLAGRVQGRAAGFAASEAAHQEATRKVNDELRRIRRARDETAARLLEESAARADLERALSDEIANDPESGRAGIGSDGLRRLDSIR